MRDFPSCFSENGVQVADSSLGGGGGSGSGRIAQNLVTCLYRAKLGGRCCLISTTWSKSLMGAQCLCIAIDDADGRCLCKAEIKPWLFSKRRGSKSLEVYMTKVDVFWDLSAAKFGSGPEPLEGFYVALLHDTAMVLLLGDLTKEAYRKTCTNPSPAGGGATTASGTAALVAKREHLYGKRVYCTRSQFCDNGRVHDITIECREAPATAGTREPCLEIRIDGKRVMQVKHLAWKFRGNQTILVDGLPVEVFWDVHSWLFGSPAGSAVFMFQTCVSEETLWPFSHVVKETDLECVGFSLVLYVWKE